ncbi:MAG TPA: ABC transporter substrate-binding protein [Dehalococcoidia bacterium]|nr:ABC transporter substrate-binding protein [Dehalococcoidia bacterium]
MLLPRLRASALATTLLVALLIACTQQTPPTTKPADSPAASKAASPAASPTVKTAASPAASPKTAASPSPAAKTAASPSPAAKTAASPQAANKVMGPPSATQRGTSQGTVTYMFEASITPAWVDPQENPSIITPYFIQFALHDAVVKPLPGMAFAPSLAESYEIASDYRSATFTLRPNLKFHNGDPVTSSDVKFTFENYRGANAQILKSKTASIETPDARTVKFNFNDPFLDFLVLYGTPASGAGWVVPERYYRQVGPDGFKQNPVGAGPYKFVRTVGSNDLELEAFTDYWRRTPSVQTLIVRGVSESATRLAALQTGETDLANSIPGELIETVRSDPNLTLVPVLTPAPQWLEFPGWEKPDNPFHDKRVRQAVSLALDRQAIVDAEHAGLAPLLTNWITPDMPGAIPGPPPEFNLTRARQLMAEAGFPNGFDVEGLVPVPPRYSVGERLVTQLREIGIRTRVNQMERAAYASRITEGPDAIEGILLSSSGAPGDAASRIRAYAICGGSTSRTCVPEIDERFQRYEASANPQERERLLTEIQQYIMDNYIFVGVYQLVLAHAQGPRIANPGESIWGAMPQYIYAGPYEDIQLKG